MTKGYVHVYTGDGKGKTTAAIGLSVRAIGAGKRVYFAQFVKGKYYSEISVLDKIPNITIKQYGLRCFIKKDPTQEDQQAAQKGLMDVVLILKEGLYDVVVMDEVFIALYYNLFDIKDVMNIIKHKPESVELILTGRKAPIELIEMADLVTGMVEIKHYYTRGVEARKGIEY
ncbi:cob(I)yrinic acid a,c-diamide adenosyltransferase [Plebeiibacterium sediminum]|uniref:corrinoid adenosyltransferase n=1 Tax=Plebeiibacterium sediminum TaxID=2992112 RepID=A0AAE3M8F3_9BACT|nr:cob(I)yrinic acid a,c-diamide adenosyltransferase [Plebeiobacterium sediminum]MCW3788847.1 cob(I)yrinic acid a,c-diamide adenosyltransferase [Plebeiobacterium sediminum]